MARLRALRPSVYTALALVCGGCGADDEPQNGAARTAEKPPSPRGDPVGGAGEAARVELETRGAPPRRELRYRPEPGSRERLDVELEMDLSLALGEGAPARSVNMPALRLAAEVEILAMEGDEGHYEFELAQAAVAEREGPPPALAQQLATELGRLEGAAGRVRFDDRGRNVASEITVPDGVSAELSQLFEAMARELEEAGVPLPDEAIGEGAQWRVTKPVTQRGVPLEETRVLSLEALEENRGRVEFSLHQDAARRADLEEEMPGAADELSELRGTGEGALEFDLSRVTPTRLRLEAEHESRFELEIGGDPTTAELEAKIELAAEAP